MRGAVGILAALVGFTIVVFAYQFRLPGIQLPVEISFWINGALGLILIIVGIAIVVARR